MWPNRTLLFGPLQQLEFHAMGAVAINVGLYQPFFMKSMNGDYKAYRCAVIPAGCKHELNANGSILACLLIEKSSTDYFHFRKFVPFPTSSITEIDDTGWIQCIQKIYEEKPAKAEIYRMITQLLKTDEIDAEIKIDPRIASIMHSIKLDPEKGFSQEYLAAAVGLSASRFRHLFIEHSDIPFRRYRMWRRIVSAMNTLHKVDNLTYAAMEAGFTDSAHFNRCFRDTFGVNPSLVFRKMDRFEV
ncbi:MAG: helix-turn-helix transcriptional regulator [Methyloglobulus sp.]|nr:helix-turn-helix transcriptional regulator [Methyloglobulus sp.]